MSATLPVGRPCGALCVANRKNSPLPSHCIVRRPRQPRRTRLPCRSRLPLSLKRRGEGQKQENRIQGYVRFPSGETCRKGCSLLRKLASGFLSSVEGLLFDQSLSKGVHQEPLHCNDRSRCWTMAARRQETMMRLFPLPVLGFASVCYSQRERPCAALPGCSLCPRLCLSTANPAPLRRSYKTAKCMSLCPRCKRQAPR